MRKVIPNCNAQNFVFITKYWNNTGQEIITSIQGTYQRHYSTPEEDNAVERMGHNSHPILSNQSASNAAPEF